MVAAGGVLVAEWAGEEEVAAGNLLVGPVVGVADDVVVSAHRPKITAAGGSGFDPGNTMVEVTVD